MCVLSFYVTLYNTARYLYMSLDVTAVILNATLSVDDVKLHHCYFPSSIEIDILSVNLIYNLRPYKPRQIADVILEVE